jgi:hypothetical protein
MQYRKTTVQELEKLEKQTERKYRRTGTLLEMLTRPKRRVRCARRKGTLLMFPKVCCPV